MSADCPDVLIFRPQRPKALSARVTPGCRISCSVSELQILVDRTNACRPFANSRRDSLDRAGPDVADGEEPGVAGLEGERSTPECLPSPVEVFGVKRSIGEHEAMIVEDRASAQPT